MPTPGLVRFRQIIGRQRDATSRAMVAAWVALPSYDEEDASHYEARVAPLLEGAKIAAVAASTAFYSLTLKIAPPPVRPVNVRTVAPLREPFTATWHALSEGRSYDEALTAGRSVAEAVGSDFVTSTSRLTGDAVAMTLDTATIKWTRMASPGACDWCADRDGGIYPSAEAGDYGHARCGCVVVPLLD
jgi:hypothetical protein